MINLDDERKFLDGLVVDYKDQTPYSKAKKDIIHRLVLDHVEDSGSKKVLQLGCSGGYETKFLADNFGEVVVVDGSRNFIDSMKKSELGNNIDYRYSLFEDYEFENDTYDYVFCNYILEHVISPVDVLRSVRRSVSDNGGKVFATVPNFNAFSRQLAVKMGLIKDLQGLTENDHRHGHRRTYDLSTFSNGFLEAGYKIIETKGVIFKILADFQLNKMIEAGIITEEHIYGLQTMGEGYPELCDSIFLVAQK